MRMMPVRTPSDGRKSTKLPEQLQAQLSDTRIACSRYLTELAAGEVSCGVKELCMVKDIKKFSAELK
jgi:hypothetical protein